jgi:hypothetical protein
MDQLVPRAGPQPKELIMYRSYLMAAASLLFVATSLLAQRASIVSIDPKQQQIVVKVGEADYTVDATRVTLLDQAGKAAKLTDFWAKETVLVTMSGSKITAIRQAKELTPTRRLAAQEPAAGNVVSVSADKDEIVVKVGELKHTVTASKVKLLDKDGKAARLSDFAAGDKVEVTLKEGLVTTIQLKK